MEDFMIYDTVQVDDKKGFIIEPGNAMSLVQFFGGGRELVDNKKLDRWLFRISDVV